MSSVTNEEWVPVEPVPGEPCPFCGEPVSGLEDEKYWHQHCYDEEEARDAARSLREE